MLSVIYVECHIPALYAECRFAECRYAECHYAECRGAAIQVGRYSQNFLRTFFHHSRANVIKQFLSVTYDFLYKARMFVRLVFPHPVGPMMASSWPNYDAKDL